MQIRHEHDHGRVVAHDIADDAADPEQREGLLQIDVGMGQIRQQCLRHPVLETAALTTKRPISKRGPHRPA